MSINLGTQKIVPASTPGAVSIGEWWEKHAKLLAEKMRLGGVKSFSIEQVSDGKYTFTVKPEDVKRECDPGCDGNGRIYVSPLTYRRCKACDGIK